MSTPFEVSIGGKKYSALPPSWAFQKAHKEQLKKLKDGTLPADESQEFMAKNVLHCIQRVNPGIDVAVIEEDLDAIAIAQASVKIGEETQKQLAAAYGIDNLGEAKTGEA